MNDDVQSLCVAAECGDVSKLQMYISKGVPAYAIEMALFEAVFNSHMQTIEFLVQHAAPLQNLNLLLEAVYHRNTQCVQMLLPLLPDFIDETAALELACYRGYEDIFELLVSRFDLEKTYHRLQNSPSNCVIELLATHVKAQHEKIQINESVEHLNQSSITKRKM